MKLLFSILALVITSNLAIANSPEYRTAYANHVRKQLSPPVDYGGVTLTDVFNLTETSSLAYSYIGEPDRERIRINANNFWNSADGLAIRKIGFKDIIYNYGYKDKEYGLYSSAERKWYSGVTAYAKVKGLYHR